ncbi:MAG: HEAT repeat domain-containing protein, partial [Anaerolineae bacterium]
YYEGPVLEDVERLVKDDATTLYTITVPVKKYRPMPIPEDTEVLDALRALDNCAGAERERQATKLLQRFEEKRVVEAISQALRKDEKSWREFKDVLQEVLSQVRETMALEELTFCLYDPSPLMVEVAIEALTETGDLRAIEHLSELSEDEELEASLRLKAAEALARLKGVVV